MTDPVRPGSPVSTPAQLISRAAEQTGANFDFLMQTAARESGFDTQAQARTSSAAGMFQFIEQTWMAMVSRYGAEHGLGEAASAISQTSSGRYEIKDPERRDQILNMRFEGETAALMAGELAAENGARIQAAIHRQPTSGELYAAHFLGASGAITMIEHTQSNPGQRADQIFPAAAAANRNMFYQDGRALTVAELNEKLTGDVAVSVPEPLSTVAQTAGVAVSRWYGQAGYGTGQIGDGVLSPALVEILASLDAPDRARTS